MRLVQGKVKMELRCDPKNLTKARIRGKLPETFKQLYATPSFSVRKDTFPAFEVVVNHTEKGVSRASHYLVQHAMLALSGDEAMDAWARPRKLFPWIAVAALIAVSLCSILYLVFARNVLY